MGEMWAHAKRRGMDEDIGLRVNNGWNVAPEKAEEMESRVWVKERRDSAAYNGGEDGIVGMGADKCLGMGLCRNVRYLPDGLYFTEPWRRGLLQSYLVSHSPL